MSVNNPTLRWVGILIGFLFIAAALAACSGESSGSDAPRDEPQSQETESRNDDSVSAGDGTTPRTASETKDRTTLTDFSSPSAPGMATPAG